MKLKQSQFAWTKADRIGIFTLIGIILILLSSIYFYKTETTSLNFEVDENSYQKVLSIADSLKKQQNQKKKYKIYPFNPNFITDYKAYNLEMTTKAFDNLKNYRAQGKWINSKTDFQKVTGVSDQWMLTYSSYFKFPDWVTDQQNKTSTASKQALSYKQKLDLNTVGKAELVTIKGIGDALANRIINYRSKIKGFRADIQIKDIYGLSYEVEQNLLNQMTVKTSVGEALIDINSASLVQLTQVPYFNYELARKIFNFIKLREGISNFETLSKIDGFPSHQIEQIKLYLKI